MDKRVFFSFHYQDVIDFRANVVRNHKVTKSNNAGYFDASIWETARRTSDLALKRLINSELKNTSVTCVLVGTNTYERRWVQYEIVRSLFKGNHIIAVHINGINGKDGKTKPNGNNPLDYLGYSVNSEGTKLSIHIYQNGKWRNYTDHDGWTVNPHKTRNKIITLSSIYPIYDWINGDGYETFSDWLQ